MRRAAAVALILIGIVAPRAARGGFPPQGEYVMSTAGDQFGGGLGFCDFLPTSRIIVATGLSGSTYSLTAQEVEQYGDILPGWPADGASLSGNLKGLPSARQGFAIDALGGLWHAFPSRNSSVGGIGLERLSVAGALTPLPSGGWKVTTSANSGSSCDVLGLTSGDAYVAYWGCVQRMTLAGVRAAGWPGNGVAALYSGFSDVDSRPALAPAGDDGVYVMSVLGFGDNRPRVVRVDSTGAIHTGWSAGGLVLGPNAADFTGEFPVRNTLIGFGDFGGTAAWLETTAPGQHRLKMQGFLGNGTLNPAWPAAGLTVVASDSITAMSIVRVYSGVYVVWLAHNAPRVTRVLSTGTFPPGLDSLGVSPLDPAAVYVPTTPGYPNSPKPYVVASEGPDMGLIFAWDDRRAGSPPSIRVRWLQPDLTPNPSCPDRTLVPPAGTPGYDTANGGALRAGCYDANGGIELLWQMWRTVGPDSHADAWLADVLPAGAVGVGPTPAPAAAFALRAASPNPAHDAVAFALTLPDAAPARLELFDIAGRLQRSLDVSGAGEHVARFDRLGALAPGLYLARLSHGAESRSARVVVTR